jgi:superoxide dismutase, Cu-Zn family
MSSSSFIRSSFFLAAASALIISCNNSDKTTETTDSSTATTDSMPSMTPPPDTASRPLLSHAEAIITGTTPDTSVTGTAKFDMDSSTGKVKLTLEITVTKKANSNVAVHIHEHGDCGDKGNMAHGHWNPGNAQHGKWGSGSFHAGDIGNVKLDGKGKGKLTLETDIWSLGGIATKNIVGKALIVHSGVDDFTTQPTGNAGSRIGCGVIQ